MGALVHLEVHHRVFVEQAPGDALGVVGATADHHRGLVVVVQGVVASLGEVGRQQHSHESGGHEPSDDVPTRLARDPVLDRVSPLHGADGEQDRGRGHRQGHPTVCAHPVAVGVHAERQGGDTLVPTESQHTAAAPLSQGGPRQRGSDHAERHDPGLEQGRGGHGKRGPEPQPPEGVGTGPQQRAGEQRHRCERQRAPPSSQSDEPRQIHRQQVPLPQACGIVPQLSPSASGPLEREVLAGLELGVVGVGQRPGEVPPAPGHGEAVRAPERGEPPRDGPQAVPCPQDESQVPRTADGRVDQPVGAGPGQQKKPKCRAREPTGFGVVGRGPDGQQHQQEEQAVLEGRRAPDGHLGVQGQEDWGDEGSEGVAARLSVTGQAVGHGQAQHREDHRQGLGDLEPVVPDELEAHEQG